jgi:hypothetical protein
MSVIYGVVALSGTLAMSYPLALAGEPRMVWFWDVIRGVIR